MHTHVLMYCTLSHTHVQSGKALSSHVYTFSHEDTWYTEGAAQNPAPPPCPLLSWSGLEDNVKCWGYVGGELCYK